MSTGKPPLSRKRISIAPDAGGWPLFKELDIIENLSHRKGTNSSMETMEYFVAAKAHIDPGL